MNPTDKAPIAPFRAGTLAALWVTFWLLMVCASMQDALRNPRFAWWEPGLWEGSSALVASGWMWLAVRVRGRYAPLLDQPLAWFGRYLRWFPLVAVTFVVAVYAIRLGVYAAVGRNYEHPGWVFVLAYESVKLALFAGLWLGILFGMDSYAQWQLQRHRLLQAQRALAEAQLAHLQGQLRPHFLFNALNTVSSLMHTDVRRADHLVATLGDLLRISLRTAGNAMTPFAEEIRTLQLYAEVMRERFRDRVTLDWRIGPTVGDTPVPALLLQPLLENVFKHGVERTTGAVHVTVVATAEGDTLAIRIHHSGALLAFGHQDGLGLGNCRDRLRILYGDKASLAIRDEDGGVATHVCLPREGRAS
jgi:two-component system, LytTR family, sensor kinase